ncbi:MAG TPA: PBP1A family penicillin-binding protein [Bradyrhizobium sp.]|nr:PBP1A family penicillin-binding protein [Bradyrhizobium sp.]
MPSPDMPPPDGPDHEQASPAPPPSRHRYLLAALAAATLVLVAAASVVIGWSLHGLHLPSRAEVTSRRVIVMTSADGQPLLQRRHLQLAPIDVKDVPPDVVNAVLSIEDRHFYQHAAIDLPSMLRAFRDNLIAGRTVAGGSTITQQLVKTLFLDPERTYQRKIKEAAIAFWLEHHLSKDEILTSYLNNVYLGSGATGFPAAARVYFGKSVADLSLPEAAMLAGMINAPEQDDPLHDLDAARKRAATVLDAMVDNGKITESQALVAKLHPALPNPAAISPSSTGWFVDWVYTKAAQVTPALGGTIRIRTTLDSRLQQMAADIIKSTLAKNGNEKHATQAALVAMRPDGAVVAMVGGRDYTESQYNRAVQAQRQPGSSFKLFDYYAALRHGFGINDEIDDSAVNIHGWEPENYGRHHHGRVSLAEAFAESLNDATVHLTQQVGIPQVIAAARDLGLRGPVQNNPSLALGTSEVSLIDITSAYAAVRAGKAPVDPYGMSGVQLGDDKNYVPIAHAGSQHSLGQYQAELTSLLQGVVDHGTGRAAALDGLAAGKTGTSQDYRDAWFIGFNEQLVVGVWVGNDDHSPMKHVTGGSLPAAIWKQFMEQAGSVAMTASPPVPPHEPETVGLARGPSASSDQADAAPQDNMALPQTSGQCNVPVCERFYHSFRASDCTYQPYWGGPRRLCDRQ